jgi:hypothetical protein
MEITNTTSTNLPVAEGCVSIAVLRVAAVVVFRFISILLELLEMLEAKVGRLSR